MKNNLFFLLIPMLIIGCKKEKISITESFDHCAERNEQVIIADSCPTTGVFAEFYCEILYGGVDSLDDESRSYMPQYCLLIGDTLKYENSSGDFTIYTVTDKLNIRTVTLPYFKECDGDSTETSAYCFVIDFVELQLESISKNVILKIDLSNEIDYTSLELGLTGDALSISRGTINGNSYTQEFESIINQKNLTIGQSEKEERIKEVVLNGVRYDDVISNVINSNPYSNNFKYYYNRRFGLIGYLDGDGELWTIKQ